MASVPDAVVVELVTLVAEAAPPGERPGGTSAAAAEPRPEPPAPEPVLAEPAAFAFAPVEAAPLDPALTAVVSPAPADFAFAAVEPAPLDPALADAVQPRTRIPAARPQRARPAVPAPPEELRAVDPPPAAAPSNLLPVAEAGVAAHAEAGAAGTSAPGGRLAVESATAYAAEIRRRIDRAKRYPAAALAAGQEGVARLRIVVARDGALVAATMVEGSGYPLLDDASLKAARAAAPFPAAPEALPGDRFDYIIPIRYQRR
jgi:protein TonB